MVDRKRNNSTTADQINEQYGKLPPQAVDVEEAVLGALLLEQDAYQSVSGFLDGRSFYKDEHRKIYEVIRSMASSGKTIDLLLVTQHLKNLNLLEEVGGPGYLTKLTRSVASAAHIEFHARIIAQKYVQRELIRVSTEIQTKSYDDTVDIDDLLSFARSQIGDVETITASATAGKLTKVVAKEAIEELEADVERYKAGESPGITTGLKDLDRSTGGWRDTNLITIAARPGVGKTSFALHLAITAARSGKWVNFYGLEMKSPDLFRILLSGETDIDRSDIRDGRIEEPDWAKINIALAELENLPIMWYDNPDMNIDQIAANTRRNKKSGKCDMVIIDYLQLVAPSDRKAIREQQIADITRKLKQTALREDIPIIELSQLNRDIEKRNDKEPTLADLRESGAIEQDSDVVIFIYDDGTQIRIKISKNRRGKRGHPDFWVNDQKTKFFDREPDGQTSFSMPVNDGFGNENDLPF